jgi:hypothetical protein
MNNSEQLRSMVCDNINLYLHSLVGRNSPELTLELMKLVSEHNISLEEFIMWTHKRELGRSEFEK